MKAINIICRKDIEVKDKTLPCIAVDGGLEYALKMKMPIICAIGDFDSIDQKLLNKFQGRVMRYNQDKDESDLALAYKYLDQYDGLVNVYGALGKRMDHSLMNLKLMYYSNLKIRLIDQYNLIYKLEVGKHTIHREQYKYISFFTLEDAVITMSGVKYPLVDYKLGVNDTLNLSNEILNEMMEIEVNKNNIFIILSLS